MALRGLEGLGEPGPDERGELPCAPPEEDEHAPPVGGAQDLAADEGRDDGGDAGDQHEGGEEAGHRHAVVQVAYDGLRDHYCGRAREALREAEGDEEFDVRGEGAQGGGEDVDDEADEERALRAPFVAHRSDDELAERHPGEAGGQRELDGGSGARSVRVTSGRAGRYMSIDSGAWR